MKKENDRMEGINWQEEKYMRLKITGKNVTLTEGIKSAVKDKIKKIEKRG